MNIGKSIYFVDLIQIDDSLNDLYVKIERRFFNVRDINLDLIKDIHFNSEKFSKKTLTGRNSLVRSLSYKQVNAKKAKSSKVQNKK